jgi:hypothetical protein
LGNKRGAKVREWQAKFDNKGKKRKTNDGGSVAVGGQEGNHPSAGDGGGADGKDVARDEILLTALSSVMDKANTKTMLAEEKQAHVQKQRKAVTKNKYKNKKQKDRERGRKKMNKQRAAVDVRLQQDNLGQHIREDNHARGKKFKKKNSWKKNKGANQ